MSGPAHLIDNERSVVFFDGVCNLCNGFVRFVIRNDPEGRFSFASLQSDYARKTLARLNMSDEAIKKQSVILLEHDRVYQSSDAALQIISRFPGILRHLSKLKLIPKTFRDAVYRLIANNRYRLFGKKSACPVPPPEIRKRFL